MSRNDFDVLIIGSGVAGQTAAEELAAAGRRVALAERREIGGTCALRGCQPKKVLIHGVEPVERADHQAGHGPAGEPRVDWAQLIAFKRTFTDPQPAEIEKALRKAGVEILFGSAFFTAPDAVTVGDRSYTAENFLIATGARPAPLGIPGEELVTSSEEFMNASRLGERIIFIGGGYISFEFAHIAASTGAKITIIHRGPQALTGFDPELAAMLVRGYREAGIEVRLNTPAAAIEQRGGEITVVAGDGERIRANMVVHGAGRVPDISGLRLDAAAVRHGPRGIEVDRRLRSVSNERVWAAGDAAACDLPLTPPAIAQARVIVRQLTGDDAAAFDPAATPSVVFSDPPLASVGLRADQAQNRGYDFRGDLIDMTSWASSRRVGLRVAGARVLVENISGRILGAHLLGHNADEVINVFLAAIAGELTAAELKSLLWAYPTSGAEIVYLV